MGQNENIEKAYDLAKQQYAAVGVDTEKVLERLKKVAVSIHCWQGDDVNGFLFKNALSGGIQTTGNYPGKARTVDELRNDLDFALKRIPGKHRLNLHAIYADTNEKVDLDELEPRHFESWVNWAKDRGMMLDFNPTCFAHPKAESGFTLSSQDQETREFWLRHCIQSRKIAESFGKQLGAKSVINYWFPDGYKDNPIDRISPRKRLKESMEKVLASDVDSRYVLDCIESKVFGIGAESYTVSSNEFALGFAVSNGASVCLDAGHFHPTESLADKLSAVLLFTDEVLLHVSRPVRWDSDHVVIADDELNRIASTLVRDDLLSKTYIGLDYFDASINRVAAWIIGTRNMLKALLLAMLEPSKALKEAEVRGDYTSRLALTEEFKSFPFGSVWDFYCLKMGVPTRESWLSDVKKYEQEVLSKR